MGNDPIPLRLRDLAMGRALFAVAILLMSTDEPKSATKSSSPRPRMVRQYGWQPKANDKAFIVSPDGSPMNVALNTIADRRLRYLAGSKDRIGVRKLIDDGHVIEVPSMSPVVVLGVGEISQHSRIAQVQKGDSGSGMGVVTDRTVRSWNVELTDGPHKGTSVVVFPENLERFVVVQEKVKPKPKTFKGGTPAAKASQTYRDARKLEAEGKTLEAIAVYRELSKSIFPEGKLAAARLKVLTGK